MDISPNELHQRSPLYMGSKAEVEMASEMLGGVASAV